MRNVLKRTILAVVLAAVTIPAAASITTTIIGKWSGECVSYVRSLVPSLPYGLYTLTDKKRIINSYTCRAGSVAVIDAAAPYGHVAFVKSCDASGRIQGITIKEANWKKGYITERESRVSGSISKSQAELRILGYYRP